MKFISKFQKNEQNACNTRKAQVASLCITRQRKVNHVNTAFGLQVQNMTAEKNSNIGGSWLPITREVVSNMTSKLNHARLDKEACVPNFPRTVMSMSHDDVSRKLRLARITKGSTANFNTKRTSVPLMWVQPVRAPKNCLLQE